MAVRAQLLVKSHDSFVRRANQNNRDPLWRLDKFPTFAANMPFFVVLHFEILVATSQASFVMKSWNRETRGKLWFPLKSKIHFFKIPLTSAVAGKSLLRLIVLVIFIEF